MKTAIKILSVPLLAGLLLAQSPWQQITVPAVREAAANFKSPPHEYGAIQLAPEGASLLAGATAPTPGPRPHIMIIGHCSDAPELFGL